MVGATLTHVPRDFNRAVILFVQWLFYLGYFEEEAEQSYTLYLQQIDAGLVDNVAAGRHDDATPQHVRGHRCGRR